MSNRSRVLKELLSPATAIAGHYETLVANKKEL